MTKDERKRAEALDLSIDDPSHSRDEVAPLANLAAELRHVLAPASASASLAARVRARVLGSLPARDARRRSSGWGRLRPAYALAGLLLFLVLGLGTTTAYASASALPGDPLYAVKRGMEQARLALSTTAAGDAALFAVYADRRVGEIERLAALGRWDDVETAVAGYPDLAGSLDELEPGLVEGQLGRHLEVLERVRSQAPEAALAGLDRALERAAKGRQEVERLQHTPRPHPTPKPGTHGTPGPKKTPPGQEGKDHPGD